MKRHYAWVIAWTGALVVLLAHGFGRMSYSVILPPMKDGLALTYTQVGLIGTGNFIGYLCLAVIGGFLAARFGARNIIFVSLLIMGVCLYLTGLSGSFAFAFAMRFITGMGNGGSYIPVMALPAAWFVVRKRGLGTGIATVGTGMGLSLAGIILPYFIVNYGHEGWRYAWYAMGIIVFVGSFVVYALERNTPAEKGLSMYGSAGDEKNSQMDRQGGVSILSAWHDVMKEREVWKLGGVYLMYGFSYIIYLTFFIAYLTREIGLSEKTAGWMFATLGLCSISSGVLWGSVSDFFGRRFGSMYAYVVLALSYLMFAFWTDLPGLYISCIIYGFSISSIPVILAAAAGDAVGPKLAPAGLGCITLFFGIGQAFGPAVAGYIKDVTGSFTGAFILSSAVSLAGALASLFLKKRA
ncbi:MAG TPA: MFS transporter [Syntrophorhabdus sp.]|nr:MFS transporter [Syntrophorhabdus sp.]